MVVTEVLPNDIYRVYQLAEVRRRNFTTTEHVSQLKLWKIGKEEPDVSKERMTSNKEISNVPDKDEIITEQK